MSSSSKLACALLALALLSEGALAQSAPAPAPTPDASAARPTPATAASPSASFESVFTRYRSYRGLAISSWRDVNLRVAEIGGWKTYARQASAPDEPQSAAQPGNPASGNAPSSQADEHAGHEGSPK